MVRKVADNKLATKRIHEIKSEIEENRKNEPSTSKLRRLDTTRSAARTESPKESPVNVKNNDLSRIRSGLQKKLDLKFDLPRVTLSREKLSSMPDRYESTSSIGFAKPNAASNLQGGIVIKCLMGCKFFVVFSSFEDMHKITMKHFREKHSGLKWNGFCNSCKQYVVKDDNKLNIAGELQHIQMKHDYNSNKIKKEKK